MSFQVGWHLVARNPLRCSSEVKPRDFRFPFSTFTLPVSQTARFDASFFRQVEPTPVLRDVKRGCGQCALQPSGRAGRVHCLLRTAQRKDKPKSEELGETAQAFSDSLLQIS